MRSLAVLALLVLPIGSAPAEAHGGHPPAVREARDWARDQLHRGNWRCLDRLWDRESQWRPRAFNPATGATGIAQAVPGRNMAKVGRSRLDPITSDWRTDPLTQVRWGLRYIRGRYGTPCHALHFQLRRGWY